MTHPTQARAELTLQDERSPAPAPTLQATQAMRPLKLDELLAVAGGPQIQNNTP